MIGPAPRRELDSEVSFGTECACVISSHPGLILFRLRYILIPGQPELDLR
jgi:hypothetical protein